jgi:hypothetical protein
MVTELLAAGVKALSESRPSKIDMVAEAVDRSVTRSRALS